MGFSNKYIEKYGELKITYRQKSTIYRALKYILDQRTFLVLIGLSTVVAFLIPSFLTVNNLLNVLRQVSITGIVAVGMTFVIVTGGIDISVGSTVALAGVVAGLCLKAGFGIFFSILLALLIGAVAGLFNGVIISYGKVLPFVTTLGTMYLFRGVTLIIARGQAIWGLPTSFVSIGTGYVIGIPNPVIITLFIYIIGNILLKHFAFGHYTLAIGGDEEAARLCGVSVRRVKMLTYGLCGLLSGGAGVILAGRLGSSQPSVGTGYELIAIAASVIGGNSLTGGTGNIVGTLLGAIILGVVSNALNLWGVASFFQIVITGGIVLVAVLTDKVKKAKD
jgi:ribose transport system permease protein